MIRILSIITTAVHLYCHEIIQYPGIHVVCLCSQKSSRSQVDPNQAFPAAALATKYPNLVSHYHCSLPMIQQCAYVCCCKSHSLWPASEPLCAPADKPVHSYSSSTDKPCWRIFIFSYQFTNHPTIRWTFRIPSQTQTTDKPAACCLCVPIQQRWPLHGGFSYGVLSWAWGY